MVYQYRTQGTCARRITVDLDGDTVRAVRFEGGCAGNLAGIAKLAEGMSAREIIRKFAGTVCGFRGTSCPDQLSHALEEALAAQSEET
ncbi:MAG: TIGR03905 family TSCPD domain-containing protein [Oscillospiraceae bacterium]|jgi:uncharacterized protein (TIGR03905 family)|nr:TIGR03905 family TSCPD domain-containing protein [Oscillospiraceae bacterium]